MPYLLLTPDQITLQKASLIISFLKVLQSDLVYCLKQTIGILLCRGITL